MLLTDIFAGLAVLAAHLLIFADGALRRWERNALVALIAFSVATHSATFAVIAGAARRGRARVAVLARRQRLGHRARRGRARARRGAAGRRQLSSSPGASPGRPAACRSPFGRMLQDGIVARYLAEHCPDKRFRLCDHQHELPTDADVFFWGESVFDRLGRFKGLDDEMRTIVFESLRAYPAWQIEAALVATARQFFRVATGEGVLHSVWHSQGMIEKHTPSAYAAMRAARQQRGELDFSAINQIHRPVALAAMLLLLVIALMGVRRETYADLGSLAATTTVVLLANAAVCGVLSNPHDRYGARMVWIAPLVLTLLLCRLYARRGATLAARRPIAVPDAAEPVSRA